MTSSTPGMSFRPISHAHHWGGNIMGGVHFDLKDLDVLTAESQVKTILAISHVAPPLLPFLVL